MNEHQTNKIWFEWTRLAETAPARFRRYGPLNRDETTSGNPGAAALEALARVAWNTALAEALTPVLQAVEIGLRNYVDRAVSLHRRDRRNDPNHAAWLLTANAWLHPKDRELLEKARQKLQDQVIAGRREAFDHHDLLATASFALWSNVVLSNEVWSALSEYQAGKLTKGETAKSLHKSLDDVRNLRNRAYHLEPIYAQDDLWAVYEDAKRRLTTVDVRQAKLMAAIDRFPAVYAEGNGWRTYYETLYVHYGLHELEDREDGRAEPQAG